MATTNPYDTSGAGVTQSGEAGGDMALTASPTSTTPTSATGGSSGALASWATDPTKASVSQLNSSAGTMSGATTYKPDDSALVSKQLTGLLSTDNPYITRARTKAAEYANSRGLLNTSIGAGAGEAAAIDAALPIAQGDANANFTAQRDNASASNTFNLDQNQFQRQGALSILNAGFTAGNQQRQQDFQGEQAGLDRTQKQSQFDANLGLNRDQLTAQTTNQAGQLQLGKDQLAATTTNQAGQLQLGKDQLTQTTANQNAQTANDRAKLEASLQDSYLQARMNLETTPNLDAGAKANAINAMNEWFMANVMSKFKDSISAPGAWPAPPVSEPAPAPAPAPSDINPDTGFPWSRPVDTGD